VARRELGAQRAGDPPAQRLVELAAVGQDDEQRELAGAAL
jgi:hypothetical protein